MINNIEEHNSKVLDTLNKEELVKLFEVIFFEERKLFETHIVSEKFLEENEKLKKERTEKNDNIVQCTSLEALKKKLPLYPDYFSLKI